MSTTENGAKSSRFKLLKIYPSITAEPLKEEINRRNIPYQLANDYLYQAFVLDRKAQRRFLAFAFSNAAASYELSIPDPGLGTSFKTSIDTNTYTFIEGPEPGHIEIFKSFWDLLTWRAMMQKPLRFSAYVLNGKKSVDAVIAEIVSNKHRIKSVMDFLDNDATGVALSNQIADAMNAIEMRYGAQNYLYRDYKDLSDYWVNDPDAKRHWPIQDDHVITYH